MIKIVLFVVWSSLVVVACHAEETKASSIAEARQSYPDSPYFHSAGFGRQRSNDARANDYQWIDSIVQMVAPDTTDECRREVICEAEAYVAGDPLLRILSQFGGGNGSECRMATFSGVCRSITIQDVILRHIRPFFNYQSNVNWGSLILNKLF
ncbi:uncharacterized protein LOC110676626 isoform X2 [Aedes aegypti]|uniref:Uncharacterized protein n=1 Tax=Aedes aegypti TaxID=7159 RepID=A0A6I8TZ27_AEDAE|nr:uncharacterized protein LOC110676626 isoform X2 [Aedes aegypti]